jgi:hypothetical protein
VNQPYLYKINQEKKGIDLTLYRDGFVWMGEKRAPVTVAKTISLTPGGYDLNISYALINNYPGRVNLRFGIELGLAIPWKEDQRSYCYFNERETQTKELVLTGNAARCAEFGIKDDHLKLDINFKLDRQSHLWQFPIYTVSLSEEGFEKVQQSIVLFPNWNVTLESQQRWEVKILNSFSPLKQ